MKTRNNEFYGIRSRDNGVLLFFKVIPARGYRVGFWGAAKTLFPALCVHRVCSSVHFSE